MMANAGQTTPGHTHERGEVRWRPVLLAMSRHRSNSITTTSMKKHAAVTWILNREHDQNVRVLEKKKLYTHYVRCPKTTLSFPRKIAIA